ncbi:MAG: PAS domain S-box protein [Gemmatimonadetes bacterium]|nr:PAS domain S-box protein [Gemmatimonadota bacterium]
MKRRPKSASSAEQTLRERESLYRALFENAPIGLGISDPDGTLLAFNDAIRQPGGWSVEDIKAIGNVASLYWDPTDRPRILAKARAQGYLFRQDVRFRRKDGGHYDALMSLTPVDVDGKRCWLAVVEDVTDRTRAEDALRQAQERYRAFIEQSTEAIWRFELEEPLPDGAENHQIEHLYRYSYLAECNDAMARMYGYESANQLVGVRLGDLLVRSDPRNLDFLRAFLRSGYRLTDAETHERDREGRPKVFLNNLVGIVENGGLVRVWGTQRDVTEKKRLEEQLRQAQKMEAIGRLAGGVAHDFNNLLTAMLGSAEMLLASLGPADPRAEDANDIKQAAARAAALTRQLLAFGRRQVLKPQLLSLNRVVNDVQRLLRRLIREDIELITRPGQDLAPVLADRGQLEQVLVNLVVNARDAMPHGGVIMIETANVDLGEDFVRANPGSSSGPHVCLMVRDTGAGMDAETKAHIFEPFFTTKELGRGTGLGLATVYGIVKQSGGYITVESERNVGAAFGIYLPRAPSGAGGWGDLGMSEADLQEEEDGAAPQPELRGGTETILVAEDEERIRVSAKRILEHYGYRVLLAADGQEALSLLDSTTSQVDLVVSDVVMPRMNGPQLYQAVRRRGRLVKFLFTSGYVGREGRGDLVLDPAVPFLPKPWTLEDLIAKVRTILDEDGEEGRGKREE